MSIIRNAIQTPDGTILESRHRHDYVDYKDANGNVYCVDGGLHYLRRSVHEDQVDLTVTLADGHEVVREAMTWGTYGKNGDQPLHYIKLSEMETEHIEACLKTQAHMYPQIRIAMKNELRYRNQYMS